MPIAFDIAPPEVYQLLAKVVEKYHPDKTELKFGVLMLSSVDKEGTPDGKYPLKWNGFAASAKVKLVPAKDRLFKNIDVEIHIDAHTWRAIDEAKQIAILDHEVEHVCVLDTSDDSTENVNDDTKSKYKLKLKPDDYAIWGCESIIRRHGNNSMEVMSAKRLREQLGDILFQDWKTTIDIAKRRADEALTELPRLPAP